MGTEMKGDAGFRCECGCDQFSCRVLVESVADATVQVSGSGEIIVVDIEPIYPDEADEIEGPYYCTRCHKLYDTLPPPDWHAKESPPMPAGKRIALGELPLLSDEELRITRRAGGVFECR